MRVGAYALLPLVAGSLIFASPAWADDAACIQSYEATQTLRKAGKLRDASAEAAKCSADSCPTVLAKDCSKWQAEIASTLPSVVFEVKGNAGEPLSNVKITANGQPLVDRLDGSPVPLEPGEVKLHFESAEGRGLPVDQTITLKEGEKSRKVAVKLGGAPPDERKPLPLGPIVFGAVGIAAVGVGTAFALMGASSESDLDGCKPRCGADDVNAVSTKYAVADILFSVGAVSLVAAAYMFFTRPTSAASVGSRSPKRALVLEF